MGVKKGPYLACRRVMAMGEGLTPLTTSLDTKHRLKIAQSIATEGVIVINVNSRMRQPKLREMKGFCPRLYTQ